jgi:hypothetical protein
MSAEAVLVLLGALGLLGLGWLAYRYGKAEQVAKDAAERERIAREIADAVQDVDESVGVAARSELIARMRRYADGD